MDGEGSLSLVMTVKDKEFLNQTREHVGCKERRTHREREQPLQNHGSVYK